MTPRDESRPTRREFLAAGGIGSLGLLTSNADAATAATTPFTLGVASGDPWPNGVVLWTRLALNPLNGGGMPPVPVLVRWQVAHDSQMGQIVRQGIAVAWPSLAHSV